MQKVSIKYLIILIIPIFIELLLQLLAGNVDKIMVQSDNLATAINQANSVLDLLVVAISVLASSSLILINQYKGAKLKDNENDVYRLSYYFYLFVGIILSLLLLALSKPILMLMQVDSNIIEHANLYLMINGGCLFLTAMMISFQNYLRSNDLTKASLIVSFSFNIINIGLNSLFLYAIKLDPILSVALGSVISRFIGVVTLYIVYKKKVGVSLNIKGLFPLKLREIKKLVGIGLPSALEAINYSLTQIVILAFVNMIGQSFEAVSPIAKTYAQLMVSVTYLFVNATTMGMQIVLGRYIGSNEKELAKKLVLKTLLVSIVVSTLTALTFALLSDQIFSIFTSNQEVIKLCKTVMYIDIALEFARAINMVMVRALQTSGDVMYPTILAIISCWLIATVFSFVFGVVLKMGLSGVWIAMTMDEGFRAILFLIRFKRGKWLKKNLVAVA